MEIYTYLFMVVIALVILVTKSTTRKQTSQHKSKIYVAIAAVGLFTTLVLYVIIKFFVL